MPRKPHEQPKPESMLRSMQEDFHWWTPSGPQSYHPRMKVLRLLVCLSLLSSAQLALAADPVNRCKGPDGRITLTERPCGDPATERSIQQPARITVEQIEAEDIFRAREMAKQDGAPFDASGVTDSRALPRASLTDPAR
jgi:hypothetical protein